MRNNIFKCWAVEQCGTQNVHGVEPATGLTNVFDDDVGWVMGVKPLFVFHWIMHLGVWHWSGVEPNIQDVIDTAHHGSAGGIIRAWSHEFINPRTVQIDFTVSISWQLAEGFFELSQGTIDFESWVVGIVGFPYRDGRTPVPVTGN